MANASHKDVTRLRGKLLSEAQRPLRDAARAVMTNIPSVSGTRIRSACAARSGRRLHDADMGAEPERQISPEFVRGDRAARVDAQRFHQVVDLLRVDTPCRWARHHRTQGLIHPSSAFQLRGKDNRGLSFGIDDSKSPAAVDSNRGR
jgi:hypothetical protein